ncbi:MAG: methyltransferase [Flavobacteriaceae bacterium]|nr:methyltransferase [Flavobacteriaceae bacterium]
MKVGTDAVLLGAWVSINFFPESILDIGAGTGVIALMMAQRTDAITIDAVEVEGSAYEQCVENFEQSNWADRLFCYHSSFEDFADELQEEDEKYDLIISNPPFYSDNYESDNEERNKARFTSSLSFEDLIYGASKLLSVLGEFSVIIPYKEEQKFIALAKQYKLFLNKVCRVKGMSTSELKRSLLTFSFKENQLTEEVLVIEQGRHNYTKEYVNLTKDFYLKM